MTAASLNSLVHFSVLSWLTGPIFEKELRVSSRRTRNYILRFVYLIFLTVFLVLVWLVATDDGGSGLYGVSRMACAGKTVIVGAVWFQFCITQIVAVVMLSNSISEELYKRTLGLLMTTPINSFQIVMGKLLSKLLQLILLLAISLPLLSIVRVFGGVPWGYIVAGLCITLLSTLFVGSVSLFFSIFTRRAYVGIIVTCLALAALFLGLPYLSAIVYNAVTGDWPGRALTAALFYYNPVVVLWSITDEMMLPGFGGGLPAFIWPLHCGIMLGASVLVLSTSVILIRRVALRQAAGEQGLPSGRCRRPGSAEPVTSDRVQKTSEIVRVTRWPVVWRELRSPLMGRRRELKLTAVFVCLIGLLISYLACGANGDLDDGDVNMTYALVYLGLGTLFSIVIPATSIASEKESRSWPLLLMTTLDERQILFGKFVGTLRRCLPGWLFFLGHVLLFGLTGLVHPIAILQIGILVTWVVTFLSGTGLYFSSACKRTTMAVVLNFALAASIWALVPLILEVGGASPDLEAANLDINPFMHALVIMDATAGERAEPDYNRPGIGDMECAQSTIWMFICGGAYGLLGFLFAWRAKHRLRRNIF